MAKVLGDFPWHSHKHEDEMFLVLRGLLRIGRAEVDGGPVSLRPGEFFVIPRGVRYNTSAAEETLDRNQIRTDRPYSFDRRPVGHSLKI